MEWVAYKSPMLLQTQVLYIFFCICNGTLPGFNAVAALFLKYLLITRVGKFQGHFHFPLASEKAIFPAYSMVICHVTADIMADILLPWMCSWLWVKLKLCQYKFIMVTRRAQDHVKETLKQPYQTIVSLERLPCLWIDAASYHEVYKKYYFKYLSRDSKLEFELPSITFAIKVPLELSCQPKGNLAAQSQRPPMQIRSAMYVYIYIYHLCNSCIRR